MASRRRRRSHSRQQHSVPGTARQQPSRRHMHSTIIGGVGPIVYTVPLQTSTSGGTPRHTTHHCPATCRTLQDSRSSYSPHCAIILNPKHKPQALNPKPYTPTLNPKLKSKTFFKYEATKPANHKALVLKLHSPQCPDSPLKTCNGHICPQK